ncbi:hypothetical protein H9649_10035 [Sporosarcina sp. Sa2YVA2]|uniref:Uncharacterized protein n=1 Tax=Sporosarcina quadrami TaxID=2762234 RepID=A0ABR8UA55_9BACL|nr:hypothetical protein [Sporosarcina quadrami]MBD7984924.1 hypothetical protein [Sporosarcina quadrami]
MKNVKMFILFGLFAIILSGCSSEPKPVDSKETEAIDVSTYFPPVGTARTYAQYDPDGKTLESTDVVNLSENTEGPDTVYIHEKGGLAYESIKEYAVSSEEVKQIYIANAMKNEETAVLELANKPKWEKNDGDDSVSYLTRTGLDMSVKAGSYKDVIEVTTTITGDVKGRSTIHYYAPEVGLIKTIFVYEDGEEFTFSELVSVEMRDMNQTTDVESDEEGVGEGEAATEAGNVEGTYSNAKFGFSFEMPADMLSKLTVKESDWDKEAAGTIEFLYAEPSRDIEQSLFSIIIFENDGDAEGWKHEVYKKVGSNDKFIFAYTMSGDPSEEMLEPENEDLLKDAQAIVKTSQQAMDSFTAE